MRWKSVVSDTAPRITSRSGTGVRAVLFSSTPASTSRLSELRRIRVARWSSAKSVPSRSGSRSSRSRSSTSASWRVRSGWLRRARFTYRSLIPVRTVSRWRSATCTVVRSTSLNALASAPSSSRERTTIGVTVGGSARGSESASTSAGSWRGRDVVRVVRETAQRTGRRPGDHERESTGEEEDRHGADPDEQQVATRVVVAGGELAVDAVRDLRPECPPSLQLRRGRHVPVGSGHVRRQRPVRERRGPALPHLVGRAAEGVGSGPHRSRACAAGPGSRARSGPRSGWSRRRRDPRRGNR